MNENFEINAKIMKAFSDPWRLKILKLLKDKPCNAKELLAFLHISQPTLSHHMKILKDSGVIKIKRLGKWTYYSLSYEMLKEVSNYLATIVKKEESNENQ